MTRIAIVGFGLIGGSIAHAVRANQLAERVTAIDHPDVLSTEPVRALSDVRIELDDRSALDRAFADSDIVILATPVSAIIELVGDALRSARVVTDCGSSKRAILRAAQRAERAGRFVPGHPMAGAPTGGAALARADLFENRHWILCPDHADPDAYAEVEQLVRGLGAIPIALSPEDHDRAVALTSHVPQLLASALASLAERRGATVAAGPGFESATRVAGGSPTMWRDVLESNADEIALALSELVAELLPAATALGENPPNIEPALALIVSAHRLRSDGRADS